MKTEVVVITVDLSTVNEFGVKIIESELPKGWNWAPRSAMGAYGTLPLKPVREPDRPAQLAKPEAEPAPALEHALALLQKALAATPAPAPKRRGRPPKKAA